MSLLVREYGKRFTENSLPFGCHFIGLALSVLVMSM